jgi:hypothetical protein
MGMYLPISFRWGQFFYGKNMLVSNPKHGRSIYRLTYGLKISQRLYDHGLMLRHITNSKT